jgi:NADH-quinone oxidoreductase subunit A
MFGTVCESFHKVDAAWVPFGSGERGVAGQLPILIYLIAVIGFAAVSLILPHVVAPRKPTRVKDMPYESGMDPVGDARKPFDIKFYLIAILFLIFDVELIFLYPWAVSLLAPEGIPDPFRLPVLGVLLVLLATLGLAYVVAYRKGVFDWRRK